MKPILVQCFVPSNQNSQSGAQPADTMTHMSSDKTRMIQQQMQSGQQQLSSFDNSNKQPKKQQQQPPFKNTYYLTSRDRDNRTPPLGSYPNKAPSRDDVLRLSQVFRRKPQTSQMTQREKNNTVTSARKKFSVSMDFKTQPSVVREETMTTPASRWRKSDFLRTSRAASELNGNRWPRDNSSNSRRQLQNLLLQNKTEIHNQMAATTRLNSSPDGGTGRTNKRPVLSFKFPQENGVTPAFKKGLRSMSHIMRKYNYSSQQSSQNWLMGNKNASISANIPQLDIDLSLSLEKFNIQVRSQQTSNRKQWGGASTGEYDGPEEAESKPVVKFNERWTVDDAVVPVEEEMSAQLDSHRREKAKNIVLQRMENSAQNLQRPSQRQQVSISNTSHALEKYNSQQYHQRTQTQMLSGTSSCNTSRQIPLTAFKTKRKTINSRGTEEKEQLLKSSNLLNKHMTRLQSQDNNLKEKDIKIVRNIERVSIDEDSSNYKNVNNNLVTVVNNEPFKIKTQKREAQNRSFLNKFDQLLKSKRDGFISTLTKRFEEQDREDKEHQANEELTLRELHKNMAARPMPHLIARHVGKAKKAASKTRKEAFVERQSTRIKESFTSIKKGSNAAMKEIAHQEQNQEIYSQSDASDYREEETQIYMDNIISNRLDKQLNPGKGGEKHRQEQKQDSFHSETSDWSSEEIETSLIAVKKLTSGPAAGSKDGPFYRRKSDSDWTMERGLEERKGTMVKQVVDIQNKMKRKETKFFKLEDEGEKFGSKEMIAFNKSSTEKKTSAEKRKKYGNKEEEEEEVDYEGQYKGNKFIKKLVSNVHNSFGMRRKSKEVDLGNLAQNYDVMSDVLKKIHDETTQLDNMTKQQAIQIIAKANEGAIDINKFVKRRRTNLGSIFEEFDQAVGNEEEKISQTQYDFALEIVKELKFFEMSRHMHKDTFRDMVKDDEVFKYLDAVQNDGDKPLPLINKIYNKKLILQDYTLDSSHLAGLRDSINNQTTTILEEVMLDNCGIDDAELSLLLKGLMNMQHFRTFVYKNNSLMERGLDTLQQILTRPDPHQLLELRLVNCATHPLIVGKLIDFMVDQSVHLRSLGLVKMQIKNLTLQRICVLLKQSEHLEDLDLSWNDLRPMDFAPLLQVLSINRTLVSLNLSCNSIIDKADQNNVYKFNFISAINQYVQMRISAIRQGTMQLKQEDLSKQDYPTQVCNNLGKLIRFNKRIQTIILNNTGLNSQVLVGLVPYLRHAKSLICLHMASNPGINEDVQAYYRTRLSILPDDTLKIHVPTQVPMPLMKKDLKQMTMQQIQLHKHKLKNYNQWKLEEVNKYLINRRLRKLLVKQDADLRTDSSNITLTRVLGHSTRMKGAGRWRMQTVQEADNCWVCHRWSFSLFFWNEQIGGQCESNSIGIDMADRAKLVDSIRLHNQESYLDDEDRPVMFGSSTNWKPRPFLKVLDFLDSVEGLKRPDYEKMAHDDAMDKFNFVNIEILDYPVQAKVKAFIEERAEKLRSDYETMRLANAQRILTRNLRYKHPNMINADVIQGGFTEDTWMLPVFIKPGKQDFMVRTAKDVEIAQRIERGEKVEMLEYQTEKDAAYKFYYIRKLIQIREENVPNFTKKLKVSKHANRFKKPISIFAEFQEDTPQILRDALSHDMRFWKAKRFLNNYDLVVRVEAIIREFFPLLKDVFVSATAERGCPDFKSDHFLKFLDTAGLTDKRHLSKGIIETYFKATNFNEGTDPENTNNKDSTLCRYEFLEMLVRVAKQKYVDNGKETNIASALQLLIVNHILPMRTNLIAIESFRVQQLWCHEVNDLLQINTRGIKKLYDMMAKSQFYTLRNRMDSINRVFPSVDQVRTILTEAKIPGLPERCILHAFYLSKMTVVLETDYANYEYTYLKWPEFLEFIGRLAQQKYLGTYQDAQWPLQKKIEVVLTHLLQIVGEKRLDPPELREVISESDDEY